MTLHNSEHIGEGTSKNTILIFLFPANDLSSILIPKKRNKLV